MSKMQIQVHLFVFVCVCVCVCVFVEHINTHTSVYSIHLWRFFGGILWWFHLGHTYHRLIALNYALGFRVYHVFIRTKTQPFILLHDILTMSKPMATTQMVLFFGFGLRFKHNKKKRSK